MPDNPQFPDVIAPPPGFERDPAWVAYDRAFRDAAAGDIKHAKERLAELAEKWPGHPARTRALKLIERLKPRRRGEATNEVARGEFVFWSTLGGVSLAANLCVAVDCSSQRDYAAAYTFGIGGALAASILATQARDPAG